MWHSYCRYMYILCFQYFHVSILLHVSSLKLWNMIPCLERYIKGVIWRAYCGIMEDSGGCLPPGYGRWAPLRETRSGQEYTTGATLTKHTAEGSSVYYPRIWTTKIHVLLLFISFMSNYFPISGKAKRITWHSSQHQCNNWWLSDG